MQFITPQFYPKLVRACAAGAQASLPVCNWFRELALLLILSQIPFGGQPEYLLTINLKISVLYTKFYQAELFLQQGRDTVITILVE